MKLETYNSTALPTGSRATTLWLVDDDDACRRLVAENFNRTSGVACTRQFASAEALLAALKTNPAPDVILSDVHMGGMSGIEAVALIKRLAPDTHTLLFTSFYDQTAARAAYEAGASGFLIKTHGFEKILESVHVLISAPRDSGAKKVDPRLFIGLLVVTSSHRPPAQTSARPGYWGKALWLRLLGSVLSPSRATPALRGQP